MRNLLLLFALLLGAVGRPAWAQSRTVRGVVRDAQGVVPGVSVYERDMTSNGTSTDANGSYTLTLKAGGVLVFRSVSYKLTEVQVGNRTTVDVRLESTEQNLNEVSVIGFGEQKKITLVGAVSQVSGVAIRENPSASLQNSLVGRLPGFFSQQPSGRPGADGAAFYLRGISSPNGNTQPLIIVDDIQFSYDQFQRLDPNEIESVSILKDAATTAIYGVRGANGVVVVTTRRGKVGPPQISTRVQSAFSQPTKLPNYLGSFETATLYNQALRNDFVAGGGNPANFVPRFSDTDLQKFKDGSDPYGHPDVNWREVLFKKFSQQYQGNIDLSGGTDRVRYFVSGGYLFQNGMLKDFSSGTGVDNNYYQRRYNYRSNLDMNITKGLTARVDLYGNFAEVNAPNVGSPFGYNNLFYDYSSFRTLAPFAYPIYNPDGSLGYSQWQLDQGGNYNVNNVIGRLRNYGYTRSFENNVNGVFSARQDLGVFGNFFKGFAITGRVAYTSNYSYARNITRDTFASFIYDPSKPADDPTAYTPRDPNVFRTRRYFIGYDPRSTSRTTNLQGIINYDRTFGHHHLSGLALYNSNSVLANVNNAIYNFIPNNFVGYSMRVGYDFERRYLLEFNAGLNGSSRFTAENRYGFFPAVAAGWNVAEESFFKNTVPAVNLLKLRGSLGVVGNDAIGGFQYYYQQTYSNGNGAAQPNFGVNSTAYSGVVEGTLGNNDVTWEKERKLNLGVDIGMFKNTITGSIEYFNNNRYDILVSPGSTSSIIGIGLPPVNRGRVLNRGFEIDLGYQSPISRDFSWNIRAQYSVAKNKILNIDEAPNKYSYQNFTGNSIGSQRVYVFDGFYSQADLTNSDIAKPTNGAQPGDLKYKDLNGDGVIDVYDRTVTGYPNLPNTTYSLNVGARYKGLSISILFQGASNFNVSALSEAIQAFSSNLTAVHRQAWTPELGDNAQYPRLTLLNNSISQPAANPSTFWQRSGDFVRLKNVQLNYDLPSTFTRRLGIPAARVYATGTNLLTWTKLDALYEFDPEITLGTDRSIYPPQRLLNLGLSVTF